MKGQLKSIAAAVLAACVCICMAGCGNDTKKDLDNFSEEDFLKNAEKLETLYGDDSNSAEETEAETKNNSDGITASDEILSAEIYSGKIQLGNTVFDFPKFPVTDLIEAGAVFKEDDPETTILKANDKTLSRKVNIDGITYGFSFSNNDENRQLLKDCYVSETSFSCTEDRKNSFICPKGITIGSTVDELLEAYGEPTSVDIDTYSYIDPGFLIESKSAHEYGAIKDGVVNTGGRTYTFRADLETNKIKSISVGINEENYSDEIIEASAELKTKIDGEKLKYTANYSYPRYLSDQNHVCDNNGTRMLIYITGGSAGKPGPSSNFKDKDVQQADMTEYNDETLSAFFESYCADEGEPEQFSYSYRINGSTAAAVICKNKGSKVDVRMMYFDENFRYVAWGSNVLIFPSTEAGELSSNDIESTYDIFFSIAESVRLELN